MSEFNPQQGCPASFKLFGHVLQKGFEAGGLIGGFAVVPGTVAYQKYREKPVDVLQLAQNAAYSCIAGVGLSGKHLRWPKSSAPSVHEDLRHFRICCCVALEPP